MPSETGWLSYRVLAILFSLGYPRETFVSDEGIDHPHAADIANDTRADTERILRNPFPSRAKATSAGWTAVWDFIGLRRWQFKLTKWFLTPSDRERRFAIGVPIRVADEVLGVREERCDCMAQFESRWTGEFSLPMKHDDLDFVLI